MKKIARRIKRMAAMLMAVVLVASSQGLPALASEFQVEGQIPGEGSVKEREPEIPVLDGESTPSVPGGENALGNPMGEETPGDGMEEETPEDGTDEETPGDGMGKPGQAEVEEAAPGAEEGTQYPAGGGSALVEAAEGSPVRDMKIDVGYMNATITWSIDAPAFMEISSMKLEYWPQNEEDPSRKLPAFIQEQFSDEGVPIPGKFRANIYTGGVPQTVRLSSASGTVWEEMAVTPLALNPEDVQASVSAGSTVLQVSVNLSVWHENDTWPLHVYYRRSGELGWRGEYMPICRRQINFFIKGLSPQTRYEYYICLGSNYRPKWGLGTEEKPQTIETAAPVTYEEDQFPDAVLRKAIKKAAGIAEDSPITSAALENVSSLWVNGSKESGFIRSLEGIQYLRNLRNLHLPGHPLKNVDEIEGLEAIESLVLTGAQLTALPNLSRMSALFWAEFQGNRMSAETLSADRLPAAFLAANPSWISDTLNTQYGIAVMPTKEQILAKYVELPYNVGLRNTYTEEPRLSSPYSPGCLSNGTLNNARNLLNFIRYTAGLPADVTLNEQYGKWAQTGTLLNRLINQMTHSPGRPAGVSDELYEAGYKGCSSSNLGMGYFNLPSAIIDGWMQDGDDSNIAHLGHRMWILNPSMKAVGFGAVDRYSAVYVFDSSGNTPPLDYVAWPAANMPTELMSGSYYPWSVRLSGRYQVADSKAVTVELKNLGTGKAWNFSPATSKLRGNYLNITGNTIIFRPADVESYIDGAKYRVTVKGLTDTYGEAVPFSYTVGFFSLAGSIKPPSGISLDKTALNLLPEQTASLAAIVSPGNAANKSVTWTSDNPAVATVDANGLVTAVASGTARITAATYNKITATCRVNVRKLSIDAAGCVLESGGTQRLNATISPDAPALARQIVWTSSNPAVAAVDTEGLVTAIVPGKATVTASLTWMVGERSGRMEASCAVEVREGVSLARDVCVRKISNVERGLKFGAVKGELEEKLRADLKEGMPKGSFAFQDAKGKLLKDTNALPVGKTVLTAVYTQDSDTVYISKTEVPVILEYGSVALKPISWEGGSVLASKASQGTGYPEEITLTPMFTLGGQEKSPEDLEALGYTVGITAKAVNEAVLSAVPMDGMITVSGNAVGNSRLKITCSIAKKGEPEKKVDFLKELAFSVKDGKAVKEISILKDGEPLKDGVHRMLASEVKGARKEYSLTVSASDFSDAPYVGAKLSWNTTNKKIAYVEVRKDTGETKLVISKGAVGVADITVTANDYKKYKTGFKVVVADEEVRLDTARLTLNAYSEEYGVVYLYPNLLADEIRGGGAGKISVRAVKNMGTKKAPDYKQDPRYESEEYNQATGEWKIRFAAAESLKKGSYPLTLEITQEFGGEETEPVMKTISVTNSPSLPKTSVSITKNYNKYWKEPNACAEALLTTGMPVSEFKDNIRIESANFQIAVKDGQKEIEEIEPGRYRIKIASVKDVPLKTGNVTFVVAYKGYRQEAKVTKRLAVTNAAPAFAVYGVGEYSPSYYPDLGENTVQVYVEVPEGVSANGLELTEASGKLFDIVEKEEKTPVVTVDKKGNSFKIGRAILVTLESKRNKPGKIQFCVTSEEFQDAGKRPATNGINTVVRNLSAVKLVLQDEATGKNTSACDFWQMQTGREALRIRPQIVGAKLEKGEPYAFTVSENAVDTFTEKALESGDLSVEQEGGSYVLKVTENAFSYAKNSYKLKFTSYVWNTGKESQGKALREVSLTLNLKRQTRASVVSATAKVTGSLNVVNPESSVTIVPAFKNLPLGAQVYEAELTDAADKECFALTLEAGVPGAARLEKKPDSGEIPIVRRNMTIQYKVRRTDGTTELVAAKASVNVVQTAAVGIDKKAVTLYNAALGEAYKRTVSLSLTKAGDRAKIRDIKVDGLDGSGLSARVELKGKDATVDFYVDAAKKRGLEKSYKVKLLVSLDGAGTAKGKPVAYTLPVTVTLKR